MKHGVTCTSLSNPLSKPWTFVLLQQRVRNENELFLCSWQTCNLIQTKTNILKTYGRILYLRQENVPGMITFRCHSTVHLETRVPPQRCSDDRRESHAAHRRARALCSLIFMSAMLHFYRLSSALGRHATLNVFFPKVNFHVAVLLLQLQLPL